MNQEPRGIRNYLSLMLRAHIFQRLVITFIFQLLYQPTLSPINACRNFHQTVWVLFCAFEYHWHVVGSLRHQARIS